MEEKVSIIPLGGVGDVTKNMYIYEYKNEILLVDCGLGFADETMLGVDLLLPDISYLLKTDKKIVGMLITHGHEDHLGALPFVLPQLLVQFPIFATPLTAGLANKKFEEFEMPTRVTEVPFDSKPIRLGAFTASFIRVTHSVPDSANIFLETPAGNFYHGSDFKFDLTPVDGKQPEFHRIVKASEQGILCLLSDCLGSEREGYTPSEETIREHMEKEVQACKGKFIVTTYSSNISRLNEAISLAKKYNRKVCFVGRSLVNATSVAQKLGYMNLSDENEVLLDQIKRYKDNQLLLLVAGSQGQENSAMSRIANGEHREIKLSSDDVVVFSADPIPGNELSVHELIDTLSKRGVRVIYSDMTDSFHVSGHGSSLDLLLMMSLTKPKFLLPIGGTYRQMVAYKHLAKKLGFSDEAMCLIEDGQEIVFSKTRATLGRKFDLRNIYVDEISGEEVESFVLRDRKKLSEGGVVIVLLEIDAATGRIESTIDIITKGFLVSDMKLLRQKLFSDIRAALGKRTGRITDWVYIRRVIGDITERRIFKELRRQPLILPIVIEV